MFRIIYALTTSRDLNTLLTRRIVKNLEPKKIYATRYFFELFIQLKIVNDKFTMTSFSSSLNGNPHKDPISIIKDSIADYSLYKYYIVSVVLNYGKVRTNHQASFIFDLQSNICMLYEPYGTYNKYGYDYTHAFGEIPRKLGFVVTTWHKRNNLDIGLQTLLIRATNQVEDFEYDIRELDAETDYIRDENDTEDKTVNSLLLLTTLENEYPRRLNMLTEAYNLFNKWTAKSCVTLTMVELMLFAKGEVKNFYDKVRTKKYPSQYINNYFMEEISIFPFKFDDVDVPLNIAVGKITGKF